MAERTAARVLSCLKQWLGALAPLDVLLSLLSGQPAAWSELLLPAYACAYACMGDTFSTRKGAAMATNVEKTATAAEKTAATGEEKTFVCAVSTGS